MLVDEVSVCLTCSSYIGDVHLHIGVTQIPTHRCPGCFDYCLRYRLVVLNDGGNVVNILIDHGGFVFDLKHNVRTVGVWC
jgi:hypothetical protein